MEWTMKGREELWKNSMVFHPNKMESHRIPPTETKTDAVPEIVSDVRGNGESWIKIGN